MSMLFPLTLSDEDKLETLRRFDQFRMWHSLDDRRYCLRCAKIISGREIQVIGGTRGAGPLRVICPTNLCESIPMDWVQPTDEVLAKISPSSKDMAGRVVIAINHSPARKNSIAARLRELTMYLKRSA